MTVTPPVTTVDTHLPTTVALVIMAAGITGGIVIGNKEWRAENQPRYGRPTWRGFAMIGGETAKLNYEQGEARQPAFIDLEDC